MSRYLNPKNYINFLKNRIILLLSPFIGQWEKRYYKKYGNSSLKHQPVFIIGAPRTGSTILYQVITNQLDVLYVDNLVCKFYRNLFFGFWLSNKLFKQKSHNCFKSNHGDTSGCGLHAPSECGSFWYRWLPKDKHFIDYDDITKEMVLEIRQEITAIINYFDKPLIFNNNNMALRLRLLKQIFPNAKFIIADREPLFVAQSLLKARKYFFNNYNDWWSIMPPNYLQLLKEPYYKQVVLQHYYINKQMLYDLRDLYKIDGMIIVNYKEFCKNRYKVIETIIKLIDYNHVHDFKSNFQLKESRKIYLDDTLIDKIQKEIERLDWNDYTS